MKISAPLLLAIGFCIFVYSGCGPADQKNADHSESSKKDTLNTSMAKLPEDTAKKDNKSIDPLNMEKPVDVKKEINPGFNTDPSLDYLMGKIKLKDHPDFVTMSLEHCSGAGMYLRKDVYEAFKKMHAAAKKDGIKLKIISATRPFYRQKQIWEAKWSGTRLVSGKDLSKYIPDPGERALKILEYSSMPGTSRHHWGTDIDINNLENSYFKSGKGKAEYEWLVANAPGYGFCQPYTEKDDLRKTGYEEERWHWSYIPVSRVLTTAYKEKINEEMITGFKGSESAKIIGVIEKYVLGIHPDCLK